MLFLTRVKKPGMIFIFAMIMGILMLLTGMGPWPLLTCAAAGLLAELVLKSGDYRDAKKAVLSYGLFSMWIFGNYLPLFTDYEGYFAQRADYGQAYIDAVQKLMPLWMAPVLRRMPQLEAREFIHVYFTQHCETVTIGMCYRNKL